MHAAAGLLLLLTTPVMAQDIDSFTPHGGRDIQTTLNGSGFTGASNVAFNGVPATSFTVNSDTEIVATAPAAFSTGPISVDAASSLFNFINRTGTATTVGPLSGSALPLGALVSHTGAPNDGSISRSGGQTFYFENLPLSENTWLYWGAKADGVRLSMNGDDFTSPVGEVMTYSESLSDLTAGKLVYSGISALQLMAPWPQGSSLCTRFTVRFLPYTESPLVRPIPAFEASLPDGIGAVAAVPPSGAFAVNLLFEASYVSQGCSTWQPALLLYDAAPTNPLMSAWSSFSGGFYYENTTPEISVIADRSVPDGSSTGPIPFTLTDSETGHVGTSLSAISDNETLVPSGNIVLSGTGDNRMITVTTVAGQTGAALVTLVATDSAGAQGSRSFTLSTNELPTISPISDLMVQFNEGSGEIPFTIDDAETPADDLIVSAQSSNTTLVPAANITLAGSGNNRTISLQPFLSQTGTTTITVTVADGGGAAATRSFVFRVNAPPVLVTNLPGLVQQGASLSISNAILRAADVESAPAAIQFTLNPDASGMVPDQGELRLSGVALADADTFSQADINNGLLVYHHGDSCEPFDLFTFNVNDSEGGITPLPPLPASFKFNIGIELREEPPTAIGSTVSVGLGASVNGQLQGANAACFSADILSYAIAPGTGPSKGTIDALDAASGVFTYTAGAGQIGADGFDFTVSSDKGTATGHVSIQLQNQPPHVDDLSATTPEDVPVSGVITATDPDLPPQPLTFSLAANGSKGDVSVDANGAFVYTPDAGRIGLDQFTVVVSDGLLTSAPATVEVHIVPRLDTGDIVTVASASQTYPASVIVVNPITGDQAVLASDDDLYELRGVAADAGGNVYVTDGDHGLLHIAADTGTVTVLDDTAGFLIGVRLDPAGRLLVAEGPAGVSVRNADGSVISRYSGDALEFVSDVGLGADGYLYVSDAGLMAGGSNKIVRIDPATSAQTVVVAAGLEFPVSLVIDDAGQLLVGDGLTDMGQTSVLQVIDPADGSITTITDPDFTGLSGIDVTEAGAIYAVNKEVDSVLHLSLSGQPQVVVSEDGLLRKLFGLAVVKRQQVTIDLQPPANPVHDGTPRAMTVSTTPPGLEGFVELTYTAQVGATPMTCTATDAACGPIDAGSYDVEARIVGSANHAGTASAILSIARATGTVAWGTLIFEYDGSSPSVSAQIAEEPASACAVIGNIGPDAGSYPLQAQCSGSNYEASGSASAEITPQPTVITLSQLAHGYDGSPKHAAATTAPALAVPVSILYDGSATAPSTAGSYAVLATVADSNYSGSASATLTIAKATGAVTWGNLAFEYSGTSPNVSAYITQEPASACAITGTMGPDVGGYPVDADCSGSNYVASGSATAQILPQATVITLSQLVHTYDGLPKEVAVTTAPTPGVPLSILYDGSAAPPSAVGSYAVTATVANANFHGTASATLSIVGMDVTDLSISIVEPRDYVQLNKLHTYTFVIGNQGNTAVTGATVTDILPPALNVTEARWTCFAIGEAICTASGSGDLHAVVSVPPNGGVVYVLTAPVSGDTADPTDTVTNTARINASGDTNSSNDSATESARAVLLRDSFESGANGAQWPQNAPAVIELGGLAGIGMLSLKVSAGQLLPYRITTIAQSSDQTFRVEALQLDGKIRIRLMTHSRSSAWSVLEEPRVMLGLSQTADGTALLLVGTHDDLSVVLDRSGPFKVEHSGD